MRKVPPALAVSLLYHLCSSSLSHCVVILMVFRAQTTLRGRLLIVYREHVLLSRCARSFTIYVPTHGTRIHTLHVVLHRPHDCADGTHTRNRAIRRGASGFASSSAASLSTPQETGQNRHWHWHPRPSRRHRPHGIARTLSRPRGTQAARRAGYPRHP